MKNITVSVGEETYRSAKEWADKRGMSVSALIREFLNNLPQKRSTDTPQKSLGEIIADIRARGGRISVSDNVSREELYNRAALPDTNGYLSQRLAAMVINDDNAKKIEALFREHLDRNFKDTGLKFDPIIVEPAYDQYDRKTFSVMVVFDGDYGLLKPGTLNSISTAMLDEYETMGIYTTVTDGYVSKEEWDMRDELLAPEPWEFLDPSEFGHLEDC